MTLKKNKLYTTSFKLHTLRTFSIASPSYRQISQFSTFSAFDKRQ